MTEEKEIHALLLDEELDNNFDDLQDEDDDDDNIEIGESDDDIEIGESDDLLGDDDDEELSDDDISNDDDDIENGESDDLLDEEDDEELGDDDDFDGDDIVINDDDFDDDDDDDDDDDIYYEDETESSDPPAEEPSGEETEFKNLYMRKCADLENFKKRAEKERRDILRFGNEGLIREVLTVVDNLERALEHIRDEAVEEDNADSLKEGVELTVKNMFAILNKFGLEEIKAEGETFDPTKHQAISHEESDEHDSGAVVKELQRGYFLKDRLLRPSLVIVAK